MKGMETFKAKGGKRPLTIVAPKKNIIKETDTAIIFIVEDSETFLQQMMEMYMNPDTLVDRGGEVSE